MPQFRRDVCQGPVEFLLSYDHHPVVADILRNVFSQQYFRRGACEGIQRMMFSRPVTRISKAVRQFCQCDTGVERLSHTAARRQRRLIQH